MVDTSGADAEASFDEAVYHGGVDEALEALQGLPDDATSVIFVGHNPTAAYLSHHLDDGDGDEAAITGMLQGFPTSAVVILDVEVRWSQLGSGAGPRRRVPRRPALRDQTSERGRASPGRLRRPRPRPPRG